MGIISGLCLVDCDGTFIPGTELRNRRVLQGIVDEFATKASIGHHPINWDLCNGKAEVDIHRILSGNGFAELADHISPEEFEARARHGYTIEIVDCTPRENMIDTLLELSQRGIHSVLVSNSERDPVTYALHEAFSRHAAEIEDVFPIIVTKTDVLAMGLNPKPSADPFNYAFGLAQQKWGEIEKSRVAIIEDSGTGVSAGFQFAGQSAQVIQFVDMATPDQMAGHHVLTMQECKDAIIRGINHGNKPWPGYTPLEAMIR